MFIIVLVTVLVSLQNFSTQVLSRKKFQGSSIYGDRDSLGYEPPAAGRIINAEVSSDKHPWLVYTRTTLSEKSGERTYKEHNTGCPGAIISYSRKTEYVTVLTAAHCICCYHDNAGFCQNPETHHCLPNDMNKPSNHQKIPANQIVGEYPPRTGISHFPFNRINIVVGLKNIDAFDLWRKDDHIFQADDAYVINAEEENGKLYLRANDRYDIGIVRARLFPEEYSKLKLEPLSLPSQSDFEDLDKIKDIKFKTATWGKVYESRRKDGKLSSSCMTDYNGPIENVFEQCRLRRSKAVERYCRHDVAPPGYVAPDMDRKTIHQDIKLKECSKIWNEAEIEFEKIKFDDTIFSTLSAIKVRETVVSDTDAYARIVTRTCYNPKFIHEQGWCKLEGSTETNPAWGFCSPACLFKDLNIRWPKELWAERKSRGRYRSLEMKLFRCPTGTPLDTRLTTNNGVVCVTPVYPVQTVLTFVKSGTEKNKRILPETMEVKRIPIEMDGKKPYFSFAPGDCGAPLWFERTDGAKIIAAVVEGFNIIGDEPEGTYPKLDYVTLVANAEILNFISNVDRILSPAKDGEEAILETDQD